MTAAWIAIVVMGAGLPLAAWWLGGRPLWARSDERARRALDQHRDWIVQHGLSAGEVTSVQEAVARGRSLEDVRLRAAAVELARKQLTAWGAPGDVSQRVRLVLGALWMVLAVVAAIANTVSGHWSWMFLLLVVNGAGVAVPHVLVRRNLRRALQLNGDRTAVR